MIGRVQFEKLHPPLENSQIVIHVIIDLKGEVNTFRGNDDEHFKSTSRPQTLSLGFRSALKRGQSA